MHKNIAAGRFGHIYPSNEWNESNNVPLAGINPFTDSDQVNTINNANNRRVDTEMTDQSANSRGLTPQSSSGYNRSSSNASYSPSQPHEDDLNISGTGGGGSFLVTGLPPRSQNISTQPQEDPFKIPAGWDMGTGQGMTPGSLTGMTPEGGWEKLMDSMSWETGRTG